MYYPVENGSVEVIQGYPCQLPPVGYGKNRLTGELEYIGVIKSDPKKEKQKWKRMELPKDYDKKRKIEEARQKTEEDHYDINLEKIRTQHWKYRLCGLWTFINGVATFIPPSYYMYLQWCPLDIGYPAYRDTDRRFFYVWEYCVEDPRCAGLADIERRRMGKTYKSGSILLDRTSIAAHHHGGIQSKSGQDAKAVFLKTVVPFFKKYPEFFRPVFDQSKGLSPTTELRFFQTSIKGKRAELILDAPELESWIDWGTAEPFHYDGSKLNTYIMDEYGKCFRFGTKIRMYDGSVKNVEDIKNGEQVMGNDSTARNVFGVRSGKEQMYKIVPKNGAGFECNESHILSLKWGNRNYRFQNWNFNDTINISVRDFLNLPKGAKKHLMLWKVGVEYPLKEHAIPPYYLGAWLGDGFSSNAGFTSADAEIIEYMRDLSEEHNLNVVKTQRKYVYNISGNRKKGNNVLLTGLQELNLINNKHIPPEYMIDSLENRLQLLAGFADTDGNLIIRNGKASGYEITQVRKALAYELHELAQSCGFKSTITKKRATMWRSNGTLYAGEAYRVHIFGDVYRIPCKVERKQAAICRYHVNRRNPMRSGFHIEAMGEGEYHGFAVDKNHLFLLADYTVVHNTMDVSVCDRWDVVRFCLDQDGEWCGKALLTTTIEEMENGGKDALTIWKNSDPNVRDANGRTKTGLYRFFLPAYETTTFDEFGMPEVEKAKTYYINQRAGLASDPRALSSIIRKNPFTIEEAFRVDGDTCLYDAMKLNEQLDWLSWKDNLTELGNFEWENGERFTKVIWKKQQYGKFEMPTGFHFDNMNCVIKNGNNYIPNNNVRFVMGCDPFKYDKAKDNRRSDCAAFAYQKYAPGDDFFSDAFVCKYKHRAPTTAIQYEDVLKMAWYFGCQILFESNIDNWREYFKNINCWGFLMILPGETEPGLYSDGGGKTHQHLCDLTEDYIDKHIKKVLFKSMIEDWLNFKLDKTTEFDEAMGSGYTLIGARRKMYRSTNEMHREITDFFKIYTAV